MKAIELKDFLNYNYLSAIESNPSKTKFAFIKSKANYNNNNYDTKLYISDGHSDYKALDLKTKTSYFWLNDTHILIPFEKSDQEISDKKELKTVLYIYDTELKTFDYYQTLNVPVSKITIVDEETWVISTSLNERAHILYEDSANREDYVSTLSQTEYFEEITTIPFYINGGDYIRNAKATLLLYNPKLKTYKRLFDKDININSYSYQEDTQRLYITTQKDEGISKLYSDAYHYDFKANTLTQTYVDNQTISINAYFEILGQQYLFAKDMKESGLNSNSHFYTLDDGIATRALDFGLSSYNSTGADVRFGGSITTRVINNHFYFVGTYQTGTILYKFDGQKLDKLFDTDSIDGWTVLDDTFYAIVLHSSKLQEIYALDFNSNGLNQLTDINKNLLDDKYVAKPKHHIFENDGVKLDGWVLTPQSYDLTLKYPAILDIHGGPKTIFNANYYHEMQVWANLGYIVFYINPRGGDTYGHEFSDIRGKYGTIDYEDIMAFTDYVIDHYAVDESRMGVTGGSYGGFMTNWIVGHTDRFKVAATQRSISNWISFYGTSDIGYYFGPDQTAVDPIIDFEEAWNQSPLKYVNNIKTPLLFIHSDKDYRCPIEQAMQLYTAVKHRGVDTRFVLFKDENHDLSRSGRPQSRVKRLEEITAWMNQYLK